METERHISSDLTFGAFLSENAEAFGLISDAHPITTPTLMIAANGHAADDGMSPPAFSVSAKGVDGLYDVLYHSLIRRSADNEEILRLTFGESEGRQTHPIARYCAALTVALAKQTLADMEGEDGDTCAQTLSAVLPDGIDALRDVMRAAVGPRPGSEHFFSVSFAACRVTSRGQGVYDLDVFHAGDFSLYIFDEHGMVPLYVCDSDVLEPVDSSFVSVEHIRLEHSEPFALFLVSKSVFDLSTKDFRAMQERPGMIWRYRMRLEDQLIRLVTSAGREDELPERAQRFFAGRAVGRDSASGAWLFLNGTFDAFKTVCRGRLHHLERLISLLPKGYDSIHPVEQTPLEQAEKAFVLAAFRTRPGLTERTMDAIVKRAEWLLREGKDTAVGVALVSLTVSFLKRIIAIGIKQGLVKHHMINVLYRYVGSRYAEASVITAVNVLIACSRNRSAANITEVAVFSHEGLVISAVNVYLSYNVVIEYGISIWVKSSVLINYENLVSCRSAVSVCTVTVEVLLVLVPDDYKAGSRKMTCKLGNSGRALLNGKLTEGINEILSGIDLAVACPPTVEMERTVFERNISDVVNNEGSAVPVNVGLN